MLGGAVLFWTRDEPPADFSDLEPRVSVESPAGAETVVTGLQTLIPNFPAVPDLVDALQWDLEVELTFTGPQPIPAEYLENPELNEALESFAVDAAPRLRELDRVMARRSLGVLPIVDFTDPMPLLSESTTLREFLKTLALARRVAGDSEGASRCYLRLLEFGRRLREEGGVSYLHFAVAVGLERAAWGGLDSMRRSGPLDPALAEHWLRPPRRTAIDLSDTIRYEFQTLRNSFETVRRLLTLEGRGAEFLSKWFVKKNRTLRQMGETVRIAAQQAAQLPGERSEVLRAPKSSRWSMISSLNCGEKAYADWFSPLQRMIELEDRRKMIEEASRLLLAFDRYLQLHGELPPDLETLSSAIPELDPRPIDPYSGGPFHYDRKRRLLWSVGEDRISQGAQQADSLLEGVELLQLDDPTWILVGDP